jgi:hypothetical protein
VQLQRAAEIDERISRELLKVITDAAAWTNPSHPLLATRCSAGEGLNDWFWRISE